MLLNSQCLFNSKLRINYKGTLGPTKTLWSQLYETYYKMKYFRLQFPSISTDEFKLYKWRWTQESYFTHYIYNHHFCQRFRFSQSGRQVDSAIRVIVWKWVVGVSPLPRATSCLPCMMNWVDSWKMKSKLYFCWDGPQHQERHSGN